MEPFDYQQRVLDAIDDARSHGQPCGLVVMSMGLGKTAVSAFFIRQVLEADPGRVLYLCHDTEILRQARRTFEVILGPRHTYGFFHGTEKHIHRVDVLFATFQTMATWREKFGVEEFSYVVVDEAHHASAPTYLPTLRYFRPVFMLGMTATPERGDGLEITGIFGDPLVRLDLPEAIARGFLCDIDYRLMTDEIVNTGLLETPAGQLSFAQLNRTIFVPKRDEEIARITQDKASELADPRIAVFCSSIRHAEQIARVIPDGVVLHARLPADERRRRLDAFRSGDVNTLLTINMLNEGVDVPQVNVIVFLRATSSETIFYQQLGRGLRKAQGKRNVLVLDFVANCERIQMVDRLRGDVQDEHDALTSSDDATAGGSRSTPLTLSLDSTSEFDERLLGLLDVIRRAAVDYTTEDLTQLLTTKITELGRVPSRKEVDTDRVLPCVSVFERVFRMPWKDVLQSLGHEPRKYRRTREELTSALLKKAESLGRAPTLDEVDGDPAMPSASAYTNNFQAPWSDILELHGLQARRKKRWTRVDLEKVLIGKIETLGRAPTIEDITADPRMPSVDTFTKVFGKRWSEVLQDCGCEPKKAFSQKELEALLQAKARALGRTPTSTEINEDPSLPSVKVFLHAFDTTWNGVLTKSGLTPAYVRKPQSRRR